MLIVINVLAVVIIIYLIIMFIRHKYLTETFENKEYIRKLPENYSPAIAMAIMGDALDLNINYKSMTTYFLSKGYVKINDTIDKVEVVLDSPDALLDHEKYMYSYLLNMHNFNSEKYIECLINDMEKLGLLTKEKSKIKPFLNALITLVICAILNILLLKFNPSIVRITGVISAFIVAVIFSVSTFLKKSYDVDPIHKTDKGRFAAVKFYELQRFLESHLTSGKMNGLINSSEKFIPYAIAFRMYEKVAYAIENNKDYRKIFYSTDSREGGN